MADDGGVLGNLPHSRPGRRSDKRPAQRQEATEAPAPSAKPDARDTQGGDPVAGAIRTATGLAAAGARVANGVAREVLRRVPRP
jgi:hypothetical protein